MGAICINSTDAAMSFHYLKSKCMQIRQQVVHLLVVQNLIEVRHVAAPHQDRLPHPVVVCRRAARQIFFVEQILQSRATAGPVGICKVADRAISLKNLLPALLLCVEWRMLPPS